MSNNGHHFNRSSAEAPILRTEHVSKLYTDGQVTALVNVSLEIYRGEYVSIMGHSGSGKSTLLNMLGMLDRPTSGEVFLDGQPVSQVRNLDSLRAKKIGFVFQSFYLLPVLSAMENVQVPMFEGNLPLAAAAEEGMRTAGTGEIGPPRQPLAAAAFRGRTAARGHRSGLGQRPAAAAGRRADRQSRLEVGRYGLRPLCPVASRARHDDRADHALGGLGRAGRSHHPHGRRPLAERHPQSRLTARQAADGNGVRGRLSGPSGLGLGLVRPPRPKSILPPFAIPDHG